MAKLSCRLSSDSFVEESEETGEWVGAWYEAVDSDRTEVLGDKCDLRSADAVTLDGSITYIHLVVHV